MMQCVDLLAVRILYALAEDTCRFYSVEQRGLKIESLSILLKSPQRGGGYLQMEKRRFDLWNAV